MSSHTTTTISTVVATTPKLSLPTMPSHQWQQPELSIGARCQSLDVLGVYKCWSLKDKSPAHLVWNEVSKAIITLLEDQIEHLDARDSELMVEMFMIGRKAKTSSPTVLFSCESKLCRRKAMELMQKKSILTCYPGISMAECSWLPKLLALGEGLKMPILPPGIYLNGSLRSCGINVLISGNQDKSPRKATVGGIVCVDDNYYGLTCAHAFSEAKESDTSGDRDLEFAFYGPNDSDNSSDDEDDYVDMTSQGSISSSSNRSQTTNELGSTGNSPLPPSTDSIATDQDLLSTNFGEIRGTNEFTKPVLLGTFFAETALGSSLDWALMKIEHPDFLKPYTASSDLDSDIMVNKISSRGRVLYPKHIAHPPADARVLVCTGSIDGTYEGTLSRVVSFMKAPGKEKFQEMWTVRRLDGSFSDGDCGSWVVDFERGVLYGHLISGYPGTGTAYIIPAIQIFDDMKKCLGKPVELSTAERKASSLSQLQESALMQPAKPDIGTEMPRVNDQNPPCDTPYVGNIPLDTSENELKARVSDQTSPHTTSATPNPPVFSQPDRAFSPSNSLQSLYQSLPMTTPNAFLLESGANGSQALSDAVTSGSCSVLIRRLPLNTTEDNLRLMIIWSQDFIDGEVLPPEKSEDPGFSSALLRFKSHRGALEAKSMLNGKQNPVNDAQMIVDLVSVTLVDNQLGNQQYQHHDFPEANPGDQNAPCNTLYVANLPIGTSEDDLKSLFSKQRGYRRLSFRIKQSGPMCFVEFEDVFFATKTLYELNGHPLHNSVREGIRLSFSKNPLGGRSRPQQGISPRPLNIPGNILGDRGSPLSTANGPPPGLSAPLGLSQNRMGYAGALSPMTRAASPPHIAISLPGNTSRPSVPSGSISQEGVPKSFPPYNI